MIHCSGIIIENTSWVWVFYVSAILTLVWVRYIILSDQLNHHLTHFKHLPNNLSLKRIWREIYIFQIHDIKLPFNFIECIATICFEQDNSFIQIFVGLALVSLHVWPAWVRLLHNRSYNHHCCLSIVMSCKFSRTMEFVFIFCKATIVVTDTFPQMPFSKRCFDSTKATE